MQFSLTCWGVGQAVFPMTEKHAYEKMVATMTLAVCAAGPQC